MLRMYRDDEPLGCTYSTTSLIRSTAFRRTGAELSLVLLLRFVGALGSHMSTTPPTLRAPPLWRLTPSGSVATVTTAGRRRRRRVRGDCQGYTCDQLNDYDYSQYACATLEASYGCDCTGCACAVHDDDGGGYGYGYGGGGLDSTAVAGRVAHLATIDDDAMREVVLDGCLAGVDDDGAPAAIEQALAAYEAGQSVRDGTAGCERNLTRASLAARRLRTRRRARFRHDAA